LELKKQISHNTSITSILPTMAAPPANLNAPIFVPPPQDHLVQAGLDIDGQLKLYVNTTFENATKARLCGTYYIDAGTGAIRYEFSRSPVFTVQEFGWFTIPATFHIICLAQPVPPNLSLDTWIADLMGTLAQNWPNHWTANKANWV
jgi:hypothetical protein